MLCRVCNKQLYGSKVDICRSCSLELLEDRYCPVCGKVLTKEQIRRGFTYCSHSCHGKSEQARLAGISLCEDNHTGKNPYWNYKNFIRYYEEEPEYAYLYVVSTLTGLKVGVTTYFYKRIEEITRCKGNRSEESHVYRVYRMHTKDACYLESYIHRVYPHKNEYHDINDLDKILSSIDNPKSWVYLNKFTDDPSLNYDKSLVFEGSYQELEDQFISITKECNLSKWTVGQHKSDLYDTSPLEVIERVLDYDESRVFTLHDGLITHNCRLRLDLRELTRKNGGLFGSGDSTGSIGVVTINLPRIAYEAAHDKMSEITGKEPVFFTMLDEYLALARESLQIKRKYINEVILPQKLLPAFTEYVGTTDNHFSTVGIVGMNEMCLNLYGVSITDPEGKEFSLRVSDYIRTVLSDWQERDKTVLWNYEATPAESTSFRLALIDKKYYPDIITQGPDDAPYYTNSCHAPVKTKWTMKELFEHQDDLQCQFTGGTVVHLYCGGPMQWNQAQYIIKTAFNKHKLPYVSISPVVTLCPTHGYLDKPTETCPYCGQSTNKMQRITGYVRDTRFWNPGKKSEFSDRNQFQDFIV